MNVETHISTHFIDVLRNQALRNNFDVPDLSNVVGISQINLNLPQSDFSLLFFFPGCSQKKKIFWTLWSVHW